ncbi:hypothetical protein INT44_001789 [Umbelopsis vinacea]|uniref:Peptidase S8/S53 domain-containing protein n=1 Tax=Umbelopsis vinacea TaxID=44442 RepID=A0A8H7PSV8_9FUNG|nr:hypothetical protein INT44_001789 [Umbelopsis vinacea]
MTRQLVIYALLILKIAFAEVARGPTHIIRLSEGRNGTIVAGDKLILQKYHQYQTMVKNGASVAGAVDTGLLKDPTNLSNIYIGEGFSAVTGTFSLSFIEHILSHDDVEYVEANEIYRATKMRPVYRPPSKRSKIAQHNAPSWGLARISRNKKENTNDYSYESAAGDGVQVFIMDTGINVEHDDFNGRATLDANFVNEESEEDLGGHGTHVAAIIGGTTFGVSKKVKLRSIKILDKYGDGTTVRLLHEYVGKLSKGEKSVINLSLSGPKSKMINDALSSTSNDYNIPIFVSAGNTADDACNYSPSDNPDVFTVGSTDRDDSVSKFSSTGQCVRLYAPGKDIKSAWLGSKDATMILDGTSMANPHVAGIAAVLMSQKTYSSPKKLYDAITDIAVKGLLSFPDGSEKSSHNLLAHI